MATILVIDDSPFDRALLVELLSRQKHRVLEANHSVDALAWLRKQRPDLVITDIIVPAMDGLYNGPEATAHAQSCGISNILTKPCEPEDILRMVEESLRSPLNPSSWSLPEEAIHEDLRAIDDKASQTAEYPQVSTHRLAAPVDINRQLVSEQDQQQWLKSLCQAARRLLGAKSAALAVGTGENDNESYFFTSGLSTATALRLGPPRLRAGIVRKVFTEREPCRLKIPPGDPQPSGWPLNYPPVHSLLAVPIVSLSYVYGWICLTDKIGAEEFSSADEELLLILADQVGRFYEIRSLYVEIQQHAARLEAEIRQRDLGETRREDRR